MFPGSSPKKRKIEDSAQQGNEHSIWTEHNDYTHAILEDDDMPSCSTKRPRQNSLQNVSTSYATNISKHPLQGEDQRLDRVREIISRELNQEMKSKEAQLELVDERLEEAKSLLERLRYAIVAEYYKKQEHAQTMIDAAASLQIGNTGIDSRQKLPQIPLHPSIKKIIGKRPRSLEEIMRACPKREAAKNAKHVLNTKSAADRREERRLQKVIREKGIVIDHTQQNIKVEPDTQTSTLNQSIQTKPEETPSSLQFIKTEHGSSRLETSTTHVLNNTRTSNKLKCYFVVGNTSKYIGKNDERTQAAGNATYSHKWLVYVQTKDSEVPIERYVKKVRFFLHPSYRPNDVVDIHEPPFQIARRGWGEFPMRIQLFFHDYYQQKPLQLVHKVVLDTTKSGRHTLGAETVVEVWLRNEPTTAATPDVQQFKSDNLITTNSTISATATTTTATAAKPLTPDTCRKPRTISFNMKETFDDNFFDFLNKIEESRTSICADIEKIEPTLLVNEPFEAQFSNTIRSPIKKELLRSPLKLTPSQLSPVKNITARLTPQNMQNVDEQNTLITNPPILPRAIKAATTKLSAAINQSEVELNGSSHVREITDWSLENQIVQTVAKSRSSLLATTSAPTTSANTISNSNHLGTFGTPATTKIITLNNNTNSTAPLSRKVFNNVSGTIILPVTKSQNASLQSTQNPTAQMQPNFSNQTVFQKKTIQVVNAQGQIKTVQMLIASPKTLPGTVAAKPLNTTLTTSGIRVITSKAVTTCTTSATSNTVKSSTSSSSSHPKVMQKLLTTNETTNAHPYKTNNAISTLKPLTTSVSKNVVFQKEGRLYIIDPLQMKLKQQRKNQVSLLKPQVKQQTQQKSLTLQSVASDHDYAPRPPLRQNSSSLLDKQNNTQIPTPQVHLGMRETRLCALKVQDHQKWLRVHLERKFNSMKFSSMRSGVEYLLRRLPLIATDKASPALAFPFSRTSPKEFHALPAFKQRSCEWLRAKFIARILRNPKSLQELNATGVETFWSTREIATFARFYAYTPPIKALQQESALSDMETVPGSKEHFTALIKTEIKSEELQLEYDSLSPATHIKHWIDNIQTRIVGVHQELSNDEVITIDDDDECAAKETTSKARGTSEDVVTRRIYGSPLKVQSNINNLSYLPAPANLETAFQYVGETCKDISVRLRPEEIVPGILHPSAQTVLAHISQLFIERLLRQTVASKTLHQQEQKSSNSHLPHNNPEQTVTLQDLRKTITQTVEFDFLTNRQLGVATQFSKNE